MNINSEQEMLDLGYSFAEKIPEQLNQSLRMAIIIELIGDVGTGKTTFVRGLAKGLDIKEPVTSPSFTISKSYALKNGGSLVHYDFYRLQSPGLMADDLAENLNNPQNIVIIEWGESISDLLPENHIKINIDYQDDGSRKVKIQPSML